MSAIDRPGGAVRLDRAAARPTISRASRSTSRTTCGTGAGQADVRRVDAERSIRCRISIFCSIVGQRTDGDCRPSRSVSSSSITGRGVCSDAPVPVVDERMHE